MHDARPGNPGQGGFGRPVAWTALLLSAILAHLPALRGFFLQDDWPHLARLMGRLPEAESWVRPVSRILGFRLGFTLFGFEAAAWHAAALLAWALVCWLVLQMGRRFGLSPLGSGVAALMVAASPAVVTPVFWASAAAEIFAVLFGLAALASWTSERRFAGPAALLLALLSFFTKESLLAIPLLVALLTWARGPVEGRSRRAAAFLVLGMGLGALLAAALVWRGMAPRSSLDAYALGGADLQLLNLGALGVWLVCPWRFPPISTPGLPWLGMMIWGSWAAYALFRGHRGDRRPLLWWAWAILALAPVLPLERHLQPYYLLAALPPFGWTVGQVLESLWPELPSRRRQLAAVLFGFAILSTSLGFFATRSRLESRDERGALRDPLARRSAIAYESYRLVRTLPLQEGQTLAVLAATRTEWPEEVPAALAQKLNSQVYAAISGPVGLRAMARPRIAVRWDSHLDELRRDALVLFDDGSTRLRFWGRVENARLYSALVAVAGGQFSRALHDLWVVGGEEAEIQFVYDPALLPIPPEHLDDTAPEFVRYVRENEEDLLLARRLILLFEQMYEAVRGRGLVESPDR